MGTLQKYLAFARRYPWAVLFALFILCYSALDLTHTDAAGSEMENRPLAQRPAVTWKSLMSGSFDESYDTYINDQFIFRDGWITLKSRAESALLKVENNGVVYGKDGYLFKKFDVLGEKNPERPAENARYLREFFEMYPGQPMTLMLVPNAYAILTDKLPAGLSLVDQRQGIAGYCAGLPANVAALDLFPVLDAQRGAYLYYRTDHHWTTEGAYLAAAAYAGSKGFTLPPLDSLPAHEEPGFYGTNFSKAKKAGAKADTITYYDIPTRRVEVAGEERQGLYDFSKFATRDKYAAFLWGNNNFTALLSDNNLNRRAGETSRVLLIKDSYGNCFAPFLTYLYDEVDIVDMRKLPGLSQTMQAKDYDDVIVLYNFQSFVEDSNLHKLRY